MAVVLIFVLGPIGLFYASIVGALAVIFGTPVLLVVAGIALEPTTPYMLSGFSWPAMWAFSIVWGILAVKRHNRRVP